MFYNNSCRPAFATVGQVSSSSKAGQHSGILFNTSNTEAEDFNSFNSTQQARPARRSAPSKQPNKKKSGEINLKKLLIIAASIAAVVLLGVIIVLAATSSGGDLSVENNSFATYEIDGKYYVAMNGETVGAGFDNEIELKPALDNSFAYVTEKTPEGFNIYILEKKELYKVVTTPVAEVLTYADYVPGVIYKDRDAFYIYSDENEDRITKDPTASNFTIAPDASAVAYTAANANNINEFKLYRYIDGNVESYANNMYPVEISKGGKYIYAYGISSEDYVSKKLFVIIPEENEKISIVTGFVSLNYMNIKGNEIIYTSGNLETGVQSYVYNAKKDAHYKIGAGVCTPVISDHSVALLATLKEIVVENTLLIPNAEGKVVSATYYIDKNYDSSLVSKYNGTLNSSGDKFYYINDDRTLSFIDLNDKNRTIKKIAEGAVDFVVTEKDNVYYLDDDSRLMFYKASTSKKRKVADAVERIVLNSYSNILYFDIEEDTKAYLSEEGSAFEIAEFERTEILTAPIFADAEQKRTFAYIWNTDTATFDLYYTSTGKTYKLVAAECNPTDESIFEEVFGELGNLGSNNNTENDNNNENTNNENTNEE